MKDFIRPRDNADRVVYGRPGDNADPAVKSLQKAIAGTTSHIASILYESKGAFSILVIPKNINFKCC